MTMSRASGAWDLSGLPEEVAMCLRMSLDAGRRWYVAACPHTPPGFLRHKDEAGFAEWRARRWQAFAQPPEFYDVTADIPNVWRDIVAVPLRLRVQTTNEHLALGLGFRWADQRLVTNVHPAPPGEVLDLTPWTTPWELAGQYAWQPMLQWPAPRMRLWLMRRGIDWKEEARDATQATLVQSLREADVKGGR